MANVEHGALAYGEGHEIHFAEYANSTAREAATGLVAGDDYKVALQTDEHSLWILTDYSGPTWVPLGLPGDDTVTGAKIVDDAIDSEHYTDGSIDTAHIANSQVTAAKMGSQSVAEAALQTDSVVAVKIKDLAVTTAKLAAGAVSTAKITNGDVTAAKLEGAIPETGGNTLKVKVIQIGTWDMDADATKEVAHGLTFGNIRFVQVTVRKDDTTISYPLNYTPTGGANTGITVGNFSWDTNTVDLKRMAGEFFDSTTFDTMGGDGNRGWVTIIYQA